MARKQFYYHEKGNHEETWYYLAQDVNGRAVVEREFSGAPGSGQVDIGTPTRMSVVEFLTGGQGTAQDNLLRLIGTLADEGRA